MIRSGGIEVVRVATGLVSRILQHTQAAGSAWGLADAIEACEKLRDTVEASLCRYDAEPLTVAIRTWRTAFDRAPSNTTSRRCGAWRSSSASATFAQSAEKEAPPPQPKKT